MDNQLAFVDVETTGLRPLTDRVIEVGIVLVDVTKEVGRFETLINPQRSVSQQITQITGITNEALWSAPVFSDVAEELWQRLQGRVLVAHNARFDYGFLRAEFSRVGKELRVPQLCTVKLSRQLYPTERRHNLDALVERFSLPITGRHRAMGDVEATLEFYKRVVKQKRQEIEEVTERILKRPALPTRLPLKEVEVLPQTSGVYIFYDETGEVLYVGKSIHIKQRVLSHFYDDLRDKKEFLLKQKVAHVEAIETAGELSALLLEAKLVKQYQPVYNRKLKRRRNLAVLELKENGDGYLVPKLKRQGRIAVKELHRLAGVFHSVRTGERRLHNISKEQGLCWKLMGLESGKGACFGYHLDECEGACVGKEKVEEYNRRLLTGLTQHQLSAWGERVLLVSEYNPENERQAVHVFDRWCFLGTVQNESELSELFKEQRELIFDWDTYRILRSQLKKRNDELRITWVERPVTA